jgi:hypothetical protein
MGGRWGVKAITRTASAVKYRFASSLSFNMTLLERDWKAKLGGGSVLRTMLNAAPEAAATGSTTSSAHVLAH